MEEENKVERSEGEKDKLDMLLEAAVKGREHQGFEEFLPLAEDMDETSRRYKIRSNRMFRERVGGTFLPYPEVDSVFERVRSWFVIRLSKRGKRRTGWR